MDKVPPEVLDDIIAQIDDYNTWVACTIVSRQWNALATPYLHRRSGASVVTRDEHVGPAREADPSLPEHVYTMVTLFTRLMVHPVRASYIHTFVFFLAFPSTEHLRDETYGVDPASLCAILDSLPNLERLALGDAFFSRPVRPDEVGTLRRLRSLICIRTGPDGRASRVENDIVNLAKLFKGCHTFTVVGYIADGPPTPYIPRSATSEPQRAQPDIRAIHCMETTKPELILAQLAPFPSTLVELDVEHLTLSTLLWLKSATEDLCSNLEVLSLAGDFADILRGMFTSFTRTQDRIDHPCRER